MVSLLALEGITRQCGVLGGLRDDSVRALFAFLGFAKDQPITVLPSSMVCLLPLGIDDWPLANFDDAVAWHESHGASCVD